MKKKLLFILLFLPALALAQVVNIPDVYFKNKLLSANASNGVAKDSNDNPIIIDVNGNNQIEETEALAVIGLNVSNASIASLQGIEAFINLKSLDCSTNNLNALDVSMLPVLELLDCAGNQLTSVQLSPNLYKLFCTSNPLTSLSTENLPNLVQLVCIQTNIISLDLSNSPNFEGLLCTNNNNLVSVNLKNGNSESQVGVALNPNLVYLCVDDEDVESVQQSMDDLGENINVNAYCSFVPGGGYNTIKGKLTFDADNNGCDAGDAPRKYIKVTLDDGTQSGSAFSDGLGAYAFYTGAGNFTLTPEFEEDYFTAAPAMATVNFPAADNSESVQDFCITATGVNPDIEVVMVPVVAARPGFDAVYKIVYKNKGNQVLSGNINCLWDYSLLEFVSMVPSADIAGVGSYSWNFTGLQPFESREITMTLNVNSPVENPPVNAGDILPFTATASIGADEMPDDNSYILNQVVVNSADPNNIVCLEGSTAPAEAIGKYLHYIVNFENTGTAAADFVVVKHEFDETQYDVGSLQILNTSHGMEARVRGNVVEFIFKSINLNAAEHGNILFKVKSKNSLTAGSQVANRANIYFDYNYPVETNEATTLFETLGRNDYNLDNSVKVYPNPAEGQVIITADFAVNSIQLFDVQGRLLQTSVINNTETEIDISGRAAGIYFIKVITGKGTKVEKLVKK
jgi:hypothetical protein